MLQPKLQKMYAINPKGRMIGSSFWTELQKMCLSVQKAHLSISNLVQPGYSGKICTETCRFSSKPWWVYEGREGALETAWLLLFYLSNYPLSIGKLFQLKAAAGFTFKCWNKSWKPNAECSLWVKLAADRLVARNMNNCNKSISVSRYTIPYSTQWLDFKILNIPSPHDAIVSGDDIIFFAVDEMSFNVISSTVFRKYSMGFLQLRNMKPNEDGNSSTGRRV